MATTTTINRPLTWNGVAEIVDHHTGHTIGWTKRTRTHAGRTAFTCYLNTAGTLRHADYLGQTATAIAAEKKVRWSWMHQDTEVLA